jgi:hypothetical protein
LKIIWERGVQAGDVGSKLFRGDGVGFVGTPCIVSSEDGTEDWAMASEQEQSRGLL